MSTIPTWCGLAMMGMGAVVGLVVGWFVGYGLAHQEIIDNPRSLSVTDYEKLRRNIHEKDNS